MLILLIAPPLIAADISLLLMIYAILLLMLSLCRCCLCHDAAAMPCCRCCAMMPIRFRCQRLRCFRQRDAFIDARAPLIRHAADDYYAAAAADTLILLLPCHLRHIADAYAMLRHYRHLCFITPRRLMPRFRCCQDAHYFAACRRRH